MIITLNQFILKNKFFSLKRRHRRGNAINSLSAPGTFVCDPSQSEHLALYYVTMQLRVRGSDVSECVFSCQLKSQDIPYLIVYKKNHSSLSKIFKEVSFRTVGTGRGTLFEFAKHQVRHVKQEIRMNTWTKNAVRNYG